MEWSDMDNEIIRIDMFKNIDDEIETYRKTGI